MRQKDQIPLSPATKCTTENVDKLQNSNNFITNVSLELNTLFNVYKLNVNYASLLHWVEYYWSSRQKRQIWREANCQNFHCQQLLSFAVYPKSRYPLSLFWGGLIHLGAVEIWPLGSEDCFHWRGVWWTSGWLHCLQENLVFWSWVFWLGLCKDKVRSNMIWET